MKIRIIILTELRSKLTLHSLYKTNLKCINENKI